MRGCVNEWSNHVSGAAQVYYQTLVMIVLDRYRANGQKFNSVVENDDSPFSLAHRQWLQLKQTPLWRF